MSNTPPRKYPTSFKVALVIVVFHAYMLTGGASNTLTMLLAAAAIKIFASAGHYILLGLAVVTAFGAYFGHLHGKDKLYVGLQWLAWSIIVGSLVLFMLSFQMLTR